MALRALRFVLVCAVLAGVAGGAFAAGRPDYSRVTPDYRVDVCVLGGGPSGVAAAISAARNGAQVLLVEQNGYLGGTGTAASVNVFMPYRYSGGVFREMLARLDELRARRGPAFDVNLMMVALDQLTAEAGVRTLLYTRAVDCLVGEGRPWQGQARRTVRGLLIHNKSGLQMVQAAVFVDCSGDGDLATWAGAPWAIGREDDGLTQPMTMCFRMGGCTFAGGSLMSYPGMEDYWASYAWNPNPGEITLNMTRIRGYSGISGEDLTAATFAGRAAVMEACSALQRNVPGFENAYLLSMPAQIGVRETRRIEGATVLTGRQILEPRQTYAHRYDAIARCDYGVDIHDPVGNKAQIAQVPQPYEIPYRCLLPRGVDNLLVAGRAVSADHMAMSSLRIQPTCYALGQAAGTAAALAVAHGVGPWEVGQGDDPRGGQPLLTELQRRLIEQGADLGPQLAEHLGLRGEWTRWQTTYALRNAAAPRQLDDVPEGHPAREAVMALCRMGVFRPMSDTVFGADQAATEAMLFTVIARALDTLPGMGDIRKPYDLPSELQGKWWSSALVQCIRRGVVSPGELGDLRPEEPCSRELAWLWLERAFPGRSVPALPAELTGGPPLTRSGLAYLLWGCVKP